MTHEPPERDDSPVETAGAERASARAGRPVLYPNYYTWFVLVSTLDILLTWVILYLGGSELNRLANAVIEWGGLHGMVVFKFVMVTIVVLICEAVGRHRFETGRKVARLAVIITALPPLLALAQLALLM